MRRHNLDVDVLTYQTTVVAVYIRMAIIWCFTRWSLFRVNWHPKGLCDETGDDTP